MGQAATQADHCHIDQGGDGNREEASLVDEEKHEESASEPTRRSGILRQMSHACKQTLRTLVLTKLASYVYDNINLVLKIAEQILGRTDAQENGTCATAFPLFNASPDDLRTEDLSASVDTALPLDKDDIILDDAETSSLHKLLKYTVLRILVTQGGERFTKFETEVEKVRPLQEDDIPLHKTEVYPLPAMHIDESSTTGNAEVVDTIFKEAGYNIESDEFHKTLKIIWGDQLSVKNLRSVTATRVGHDSPGNALIDNVYGPGLFHAQIATCSTVLETHWGDPNTYTVNPGSLHHHNTYLARKPIVLLSLPPYRTCRDLIFVSLYARIFHCLELIINKPLDEYAASVTFDELVQDVDTLLERHSTSVVSDLRDERADERAEREERRDKGTSKMNAMTGTNEEDSPEGMFKTGDMVYENAVLFLRDALILRAFNDSIKAGASGCIVLVLKMLALMFRGSSHTKYAHELFHLIHNLTHVWPEPLRRVILQNWLVNPTGKPNAWVPVDLMQEHMNYWIKVIYKAHGSNATFEWLEMISPCIDTLRKLATQMNQEMGSRQGSRHASPDLWRDISELMKSLQEHSVYTPQKGRTIPGDKAEATNIITEGVYALTKPLKDYNNAFQKLQERRRMTPLVGQPAIRSNEQPTALTHFEPNGNATRVENGRGEFEECTAEDGGPGLVDVLDRYPDNTEGMEPEEADDNQSQASDESKDLFEQFSTFDQVDLELALSRDAEEDVELYMD